MAISSVTYGTSSVLNQSVLSLKNQMTQLQSQLTTGEKSTTYAGMGVNEGFAIAARSQLAQISAFTDTMTNVNTNIGVANTALQAMVNIGTTVQNSAYSASQALNSTGQTIGQQTATAQLSSMLGVLNTQAGDRYLFSGTAVNTPSVASMDNIINGTTTSHLSGGCDFACHEKVPHNDNIYINDSSNRQVLLSSSYYTSGAANQNVYYLWNTSTSTLYNSSGNSMNTSSPSTAAPTTTTSGYGSSKKTIVTTVTTTTVVTYSITDSTTGPVTITQTTASTPTTVTVTTPQSGPPTTSTVTGSTTTSSTTYDTGYWADGYWLTHHYGLIYSTPSSITLRKDDVVSAASQLIPYAANQSSQYQVTYQMQMLSFDWTHPSATTPVTALNSMTNVASYGSGFSVASLIPADDYWWQNSEPTTSTNINDQGTEFTNMLSAMNNIMATPGTGAASSTPQEIMFIITDGMSDELSGGSRWHGPLNSNDLAQCTAIKARGIKIAILYTQYLPQALIGDSWSQSNIAPYLPPPPSPFPAGNAGTSDQDLTALQSCASPGSNGSPLVQTVTTDGDFTVALQQLFSTALQAPRLVR